MRCWPAAAVAISWLAGPASAAADQARRCPGEDVHDALREATPDGELVIGSGARLKLADLRLAPAASPGGAVAPDVLALLASFQGSRLAIRVVGPEDRWARRPAAVALAGAGAAIDFAELLVGEGFALVDPGARDALCRPDLLTIEQAARRARRGIWSRISVLRAEDPDSLKAAAGRFSLVEGRIISVGERRDRTYLNFGVDFSHDFAVVVPRKSWAAFKRAGRDAAALKGRRVRVRGQLEIGRAPSMELTVPDMVEWLPDEARRNRTEPNL